MINIRSFLGIITTDSFDSTKLQNLIKEMRYKVVISLFENKSLLVLSNYDITICDDGNNSFVIYSGYDDSARTAYNKVICRDALSCMNTYGDVACVFYVDRNNANISISTDKFGKHCVYYANVSGIGFIFSNRYSVLLRYVHNKSINKEVLAQYMALSYVPGPECIVNGTYKILPAHNIVLSRGGDITEMSYWSPSHIYHTVQHHEYPSYEQACSLVENELLARIEDTMCRSNKIGCFLSGGIDSSLVTALFNKVSPGIDTFCIGFHETNHNEALIAKATSAHLGTNHHELYINETNFSDLLDTMLDWYDEPFGDSSQVATFFACNLAKNYVDNVLTGDGGDELFWGYDDYTILAHLYGYRHILTVMRLFAEKLKLLESLPPKVAAVLEGCQNGYQSQMLSKRFDSMALETTGADAIELHLEEQSLGIDKWHHRKAVIDIMTGVPEVMYKVNRAADANTLNSISPFLNDDMLGLAYSLPDRYKYHHGVKKRILKDILFRYVPPCIVDKPKHGFTIPVKQWLNTILAGRITEFSESEFVLSQGIFSKRGIQKYCKLFLDGVNTFSLPAQQFMYRYIMFQLWYAKYIG